MDSRNTTLDIARGLGIIIVCIYHIVYRPEMGFADMLILGGIWFILPFFFVISGYLYKPDKLFSVSENIIYRIKRLLIPALKYTITLLLLWGLYCVIVHGVTLKEWARDIVLTYLRPEFYRLLIDKDVRIDGLIYDMISTVWFLWTMILAAPLFYIFVDFTNKRAINLFLVCAVLIIISTLLHPYNAKFSWSLTLIPVYSAAALCGAFMNSHDLINKFFYSKYKYILAIIAAIIHVKIFNKFGSFWVFSNSICNDSAGNFAVLIFFLQVFIGGYAYIVLCDLINKCGVINKILAFIGANSLVFVFMHRIFSTIFADIIGAPIKSWEFWYVPFTAEAFIKSFCGFIFTIIMCSILACIINKRAAKL